MLRSSFTTASKKSSVSRFMSRRSSSSKLGKRSGSGFASSRLRNCSHCPAKFSASALAFGSRTMRLTCVLRTDGLRKRPDSASGKQFVVGHAAPKEIGQTGCQLKIADRVLGLGVAWIRIPLDSKQKLRRDQNGL